MRITIVSRAENVSGKEIMTLELGEGLRSAAHEVGYVTSRWNDGNYMARLGELEFSGRRLDLGGISATLNRDSLWMTLRQMVRLPGLWVDYRRFLREERPDRVIHTSWHHLLLLWPFLKPERDWYWVHEVLPDKSHYRAVFARLARRLSGFVPVSEAVGRSLLALRVPMDKMHVVHNGLTDLSAAISKETGKCTGRIGIVGQVEPWKGHHHLLTALASITGQFPQAEIHIFGSGSPSYERQLRQQAVTLGIAARVQWHGFMTERRAIYEQLDLCVVPVFAEATEALPTVAIEAGFFGLPVVASRVGGLPEIVEDAETGFLVEPGDVRQLAVRLQDLLANPSLSAKMGAAARQRVRRLFNRERFVTEFIRVLESGTTAPTPK